MEKNSEKFNKKYVLVSVYRGTGLNPELSLDELEELLDTAGGVCVGRIIQNLERFNNKCYVGTGKVEEINELVQETGAIGIICDDELSSIQIKNLSEELNVEILDRTLLILEIFANQAKSHEGKIQVEMARLKYKKSHLLGIGTKMSRQGGSSSLSSKGSGETKLETDRRYINERISLLSKELKEIEKHRDTLRKNHEKNKLPVISLVGYTNAGKSTLLNTLADENIYAKDKLFATLDTTTRKINLNNNSEILITDTVGFIQKLPHTLVQSFKSTFEEISYSDIIIHVVDSSSPIIDEQIKTVIKTLEDFGWNKPIITAFNKIDKDIVTPLPTSLVESSNSYGIVNISAKTGQGMEDLKQKIENVLKTFKTYVEIILPFSEGALLNNIHEKCDILNEEYVENGILLKFYSTDKIFNQVEKYKI